MEETNVLTTQELSKYLKLNEKTVLRMAQSGQIPGFKIANQWRFYLSDVDEYLQDKVAKSTGYEFDRIVRTTDVILLSRLVGNDTIKLNLDSDNKEGVLSELAYIAHKAGIAVSVKDVFKQLKRREEMLSTAVGKGVAIPHPRNPSDELFKMPGVVIARSKKGIDFAAPDGKQVHLFFMTCAPDVVLHLKLLSKIAKLLEARNNFKRIMSAETKDEAMKILLENERLNILLTS